MPNHTQELTQMLQSIPEVVDTEEAFDQLRDSLLSPGGVDPDATNLHKWICDEQIPEKDSELPDRVAVVCYYTNTFRILEN